MFFKKEEIKNNNFQTKICALLIHAAKIDENYTERTSVWFPYLTEIVERFNGQVTQVRLIKLEKGYNLGEEPHIDYPWYKGIRMHIPLTDGVQYEWHVLEEQYILDGSQPHIYYLDTGKPHTAKNKAGSIDRWVFNINLIPHTSRFEIQQHRIDDYLDTSHFQ